jgi:hypothetical protein
MAHFAQLDENNIVTQVVVINDEDITDDNGVEQEFIGVEFCQSIFGQNTVWKQTSYNGNIRKNYAGIGDTYKEDIDAFIGPQPYPSWTLDEDIGQWEAPVPHPMDENLYTWNETTQQWDQVDV